MDPEFPARAKEYGRGVIVGGTNYGQGSSREHAALVPLYLGIRAIVAKSFARIHRANLLNSGILPLTFENEADYDRISLGDELELAGIREVIESGAKVVVKNKTTGDEIVCDLPLSDRQKKICLAGGLLNYTGNCK